MKIGVIVPVYNSKRYLLKCIKSILCQTYRDFSLILVDDGSTDESGRICDLAAERDARVFVIHNTNQGSVEARKSGVNSEAAQACDYLCFVDSDDILKRNALEIMAEYVEKYNLDTICAKSIKVWRGIKVPHQYCPPCFEHNGCEIYEGADIVNKLYVSCFGISNYPVTLYAKLYRRTLLTEVMDYPSVVKFMGDDLLVTLHLLPNSTRIGIIPDAVYLYRMGGGTSKFMPYMLDDFLALYDLKLELLQQYAMPQDAEYLMSVELMNVLHSWYSMYRLQGNHSEKELLNEIRRTAEIQEVKHAIGVIAQRKQQHSIAEFFRTQHYQQLCEQMEQEVSRYKWKYRVKKLIMRL